MRFFPSIVQIGKAKAHRGWTLPEMLVTVGAGSLFLAVMATVSQFSTRSLVALGNYADLDRASCNALDRLSRDVRNAAGLTYFSTNQITMTNKVGVSCSYTFLPSAGTFTRQSGGQTTVLLKSCDYLTFQVFQRNPSNNFTFWPTTNSLSEAKLLNVSWRCSRKILGQKVNTESVQTAKIVIRN